MQDENHRMYWRSSATLTGLDCTAVRRSSQCMAPHGVLACGLDGLNLSCMEPALCDPCYPVQWCRH
eukprot:2106027-Amphidinium_carterae.1